MEQHGWNRCDPRRCDIRFSRREASGLHRDSRPADTVPAEYTMSCYNVWTAYVDVESRITNGTDRLLFRLKPIRLSGELGLFN